MTINIRKLLNIISHLGKAKKKSTKIAQCDRTINTHEWLKYKILSILRIGEKVKES